jgi:hypothetical protein
VEAPKRSVQDTSYPKDVPQSFKEPAEKASPIFASALQDARKTGEETFFNPKEPTWRSESLQNEKPPAIVAGDSLNNAFKTVAQSRKTNETPVIMDATPAYSVIPKEHFVTMLKPRASAVAAEPSKTKSRNVTLKRKKSWFRRLFSGFQSNSNISSTTITTSSKEEQRDELKRQAAMTRTGSPSFDDANNKRRFSLRNLLRGRREKKAPVRPRRSSSNSSNNNTLSSLNDSIDQTRISADEASRAADDIEQILRM